VEPNRLRSSPVAALLALVAASLAGMSFLHLSGILAGGSPPFDPTHAGVAEAVICVVLVGAVLALIRGSRHARTTAAAATAFAVIGFVVGLTFTVRGGGAVDVAYHVLALPLLLLGLGLLLRR
jgi:hypothetical protein